MLLIARVFWSLALLTTSILLGCRPQSSRHPVQERVLMHTSFEELDGWGSVNNTSLTNIKAHTGQYAISVDPQHQYSITYHAELGKLVPHHRPRRLILRAWVWVPNAQADARFIIAIAPAGDPDHPIFSKNVFLTDHGSSGEWKQIERSLELPENIASNNRLIIYLWNAASSVPVYADDLELIEFW